MSSRVAQRAESWQLYGTSRQVAVLATVAFAAGVLLSLVIDAVAVDTFDAGTIQGWTLVPQLVAAGCLMYIGYVAAIRSFFVMSALILVIITEETFHVMNPVAVRLVDQARDISDLTGIRFGYLAIGLVYGAIAAIGFALIYIAYRGGSHADRAVIRNITILLIIGGLFGGPIGAIGELGNRRYWLLVEETGEAIVFAVIAGYAAGLAMLVRSNRSRHR